MKAKSKTSDIIDNLMLGNGFRRKRDVAKYFGVTPQALSLWIAKDKIPPKHLLKISKETTMKTTAPMSSKSSNQETEEKTVINYLMRENVALKEKIKLLENQKQNDSSFIPEGDLFNKIMADSLLIAGLGNLPAVAVSGMGLGIFEEWADYLLGTEFRIAAVFSLLVLILVYRRFKLSRKREYLK